jgi:hypothetical protein
MRVKAVLLIGAAITALSLAACSSSGDSGTPNAAGSNPATTAPSAEASPTTGGAGGTVTGRDGCLMGSWKVDVDDMAKQTAERVGRGATGKGTGAITLAFGDKMSIKYDNTVIAIKAPVSEGLVMDMKNTFKGEAISSDWVAKDGKLGGTMPSNTVKSTITMSMGGQTVPSTTTPFEGALDLAQGNLGYTCSGSTATFISPIVTWKLTKI